MTTANHLAEAGKSLERAMACLSAATRGSTDTTTLGSIAVVQGDIKHLHGRIELIRRFAGGSRD